MFPVTIVILLGGALFVSTVANIVLAWIALKWPVVVDDQREKPIVGRR